MCFRRLLPAPCKSLPPTTNLRFSCRIIGFLEAPTTADNLRAVGAPGRFSSPAALFAAEALRSFGWLCCAVLFCGYTLELQLRVYLWITLVNFQETKAVLFSYQAQLNI